MSSWFDGLYGSWLEIVPLVGLYDSWFDGLYVHWLEIATLVGLYDAQRVRWVVRQLVRVCTAVWIGRCLAGLVGCTTAG